MEASEFLATVETVHSDARARGLYFQHASDARLTGRRVTIGARELTSFASCSYLGLEHHPALVAGVVQAVERYGTQFSASRGYVSAPLYAELEALLGDVFGGHVLVTASTTLGHLTALPVLATERDAIVLDHQVHHSVQSAATIARANGTRVEVVRHGELDTAVDLVAKLARTSHVVWFACDGVYSMYGDLAPIGLIRRILAVAPNVRLYVDDAHGMSWAGEHGRGSFLSRFPLSERVVVATSLNKAFSAAGGCVIFHSEAERERVRMCGGPMVFSGPIQPPMLGAAVASARLHLSEEITRVQGRLRERVDLCNALLAQHRLALLSKNESPIFFIELGLPEIAFDVAQRISRQGLYVCVSAYPAVPMKRAGIRLTLTAEHALEDVERVVERLAEHVPAALASHGISREQIDTMFQNALPLESRVRTPLALVFAAEPTKPSIGAPPVAEALAVETCSTIEELDRATWDALLGSRGACSWDAMRLAERVFRGHPQPEHDWSFLYVIVRDSWGRPIAATFFTGALCKDDMLVRSEVSHAVEARRVNDPYFLTSRALMMGSLVSEGTHLYLDKSGPWRAAMERILEVASKEYERTRAGVLILRDLPADDPEMDALLLRHGMLKVPMLDTHALAVLGASDYQASLRGHRRKYFLRNSRAEKNFELRVNPALDDSELEYLHSLYLGVARKNRRLNVFELPRELLRGFLENPAWELATLHFTGGPPVAFYAAYRHDGVYAPFLCGLDYRYVFEHGTYRQLLHQTVLRARALGARELRLGMGADTEKDRFGTSRKKCAVYVQARDDYGGAQLREIVAELALERAGT